MTHAIPAIREEFPGLHHQGYFNFGGQGPLPRVAKAAILGGYDTLEEIGPFSLAGNRWAMEQIADLKQVLARELGITAEGLTLTENVTVGCNIPLWGIPWRAGDRLLLTDCEHPGIIALVQELSRRFGVVVDCVAVQNTLNGGDPVAAIAEAIRPDTRALVISHLLWNTGQVLPLKAISQICHDRSSPLWVIVDAAQSVGCLPLDLTDLGVDAYAFTGHKWLCGPAGVGGVYIRPDRREELAPTFIGWRGITEAGAWRSDGSRYEVATGPYPLYGGLRAVVELHQSWGSAQDRHQRITQLAAQLWQGLQSLPQVQTLRTAPPEAGLISFFVPHPQQLVNQLEERGYRLRTLADPHCVRACVHYFTTEDEVNQLLNLLGELLA